MIQVRALLIAAALTLGPEPALLASGPDDFLRGGPLPADWKSAPDHIVISPEWSEGFRKIIADSSRDEHEQGACLNYGRSLKAQQRLSDEMMSLGGLQRQLTDARDLKEATRIARLEQQIAGVRAKIAAEALGGIPPEYQLSLVTKGITASVHVPACMGSQVGSMHTHPYKMSYDTALPSDGDVGNTWLRFREGSINFHAIVDVNGIALLVPTDEMLRRFSPFHNDADISADDQYTRDGAADLVPMRLMNLVQDHVGSDSLRAQACAAILHMYGIVLYKGVLPDLAKVEVPEGFDAGPFRFENGRLIARRSLDDIMVAIAAGLTQKWIRGEKLNVEVVRQRAAVLAKADDLAFLSALGLPVTEEDVRVKATDRTATYDVGSCLQITLGQGIVFRPHCWASFVGVVQRTSKCQDASPDLPQITWGTAPAETRRSVGFAYQEPGNPAMCHQVFYSLANDGTVGAKTWEGTRPAD